jgi:hypothetical protein
VLQAAKLGLVGDALSLTGSADCAHLLDRQITKADRLDIPNALTSVLSEPLLPLSFGRRRLGLEVQ